MSLVEQFYNSNSSSPTHEHLKRELFQQAQPQQAQPQQAQRKQQQQPQQAHFISTVEYPSSNSFSTQSQSTSSSPFTDPSDPHSFHHSNSKPSLWIDHSPNGLSDLDHHPINCSHSISTNHHPSTLEPHLDQPFPNLLTIPTRSLIPSDSLHPHRSSPFHQAHHQHISADSKLTTDPNQTHPIILSTDHQACLNPSIISTSRPSQSSIHPLSESISHPLDHIISKTSVSNSPTLFLPDHWTQSFNQHLQSTESLSASQVPVPLNDANNPPPYSIHSEPQSILTNQSSNSTNQSSTRSLPVSCSNQLAHHLLQIPDPSNLLSGRASSCVSTQPITQESGHNAVEKRYRNNINSHIAALADLVPALQHLRALPSAATSRRHSSQFIVSTSAIGKIPAGLVDGVKAATKLSKGNILSKSVDYVKHLLWTRSEMQEDMNELKEMIRSRVDGGQILILEWEERINSKIPERQRQRMIEQNEAEEEADDEEEVGKGLMGNSTKRRKLSDQLDSLGLTKGRAIGKSISMNKNQKKIPDHLVPPTLPITLNSHQPVPSSSPLHSDGSNSSHHQTLSLDQSHPIEEFNLFKPTQTIPRHSSYTEVYQPTQDFLNQSFMNPFQSNLSHLPPSNLLAVSMGLSFAVGSFYHYYQIKSFTTPSYTSSANPTYRDDCLDDQVRFGKVRVLDHEFIRAGIQTVSMASMIFVVLILLKPEFLLSFLKPSYHISTNTNIKIKTTKDLVKEEEEEDYLMSIKRIDERIGVLGFGVECFKAFGRLSIFMGFPRFSFLSSWMISFDHQQELRSEKKIWLKIAEIQTLNGTSQTSFFHRLYTALRLYNLIDWNLNKEVEEIEEVIRLMIILSLHLCTLFGIRNLMSQTLWNQAKGILEQSLTKTSGLIKEGLQVDLIDCQNQSRWEIKQVLNLSYEEVIDLIECSKSSYRLLSNEENTESRDPIQTILEKKCEIELIEIWSRIFVSTIKKTTPIETNKSKLSQDFKLESIEGLPTRLEEAGDHYALQVSAGRSVVEESIERINGIFKRNQNTNQKLRKLVWSTKGVWSLAFGRESVANEIGNRLLNELEEEELGSVEGYLELVMKIKINKKEEKIDSQRKEEKFNSLSTLDKLATLTIKWILIRKLHLSKNVLPNQTWYNLKQDSNLLLNEIKENEIKERCLELKKLIIGFELNREMNDKSTKQSIESILNGESKEYDLFMGLKDCLKSIEVIQRFV